MVYNSVIKPLTLQYLKKNWEIKKIPLKNFINVLNSLLNPLVNPSLRLFPNIAPYSNDAPYSGCMQVFEKKFHEFP